MLYDNKKWGAKLSVNTGSFMTAAQLGINEAQYRALIKTLGRFERGEIPSLLFTMRHTGSPECGTTGCICGWAREGNCALFFDWADHPKLCRLFAPNANGNHPAWGATVPQAGSAIRNFLTTGNPMWDEVMDIK